MTSGDENVFRLDVAMHHPLLVRVAQCISNFSENLRRFLNRQLTNTGKPCAKILSTDERHRVVEERALRTCGQQRNDVRMLKSCSELNLAAESVDVDSRCEIGREDLDDDLAVQLDIGCNEDTRHSCAAELAIDAVCCAQQLLKLALKVRSHGPNMRLDRWLANNLFDCVLSDV